MGLGWWNLICSEIITRMNTKLLSTVLLATRYIYSQESRGHQYRGGAELQGRQGLVRIREWHLDLDDVDTKPDAVICKLTQPRFAKNGTNATKSCREQS